MGLWLSGFRDIYRQLVDKDGIPNGQIGGILSPLLERLRVGHAAQWVTGKRVLDCGCGRGKLLEILAPDVSYTGVDHDPGLISYLRQRYPQAQFLSANVEEVIFSQAVTFDSIVMTALLEHLDSPQQLRFCNGLPAGCAPGAH